MQRLDLVISILFALLFVAWLVYTITTGLPMEFFKYPEDQHPIILFLYVFTGLIFNFLIHFLLGIVLVCISFVFYLRSIKELFKRNKK